MKPRPRRYCIMSSADFREDTLYFDFMDSSVSHRYWREVPVWISSDLPWALRSAINERMFHAMENR